MVINFDDDGLDKLAFSYHRDLVSFSFWVSEIFSPSSLKDTMLRYDDQCF